MAYNELLADRIQLLLGESPDLRSKKMFGGITFMYRGNMAVGVFGDRLMVRCGPARYEALLEREHVYEMDFTGKGIRGFLYVDLPALQAADALQEWLDFGLDFAGSLPAK